MTTTNNTLLRTVQLTVATLTLSLLWLAPQALAHGNPNAPTGCSARALAFSFCYGSIISFSQGNRVSTPGQPFVVEWGSPLTLTIDSASPYTFVGSNDLFLEPPAGGFGTTLRVLCGDGVLNGRIRSSRCSRFVNSGEKSMTIPLTGPGFTGTLMAATYSVPSGQRGGTKLHADGKSVLTFVPAGTIKPKPGPRPNVGSAPFISSVNINSQVPAGGSVSGTINFTDPDGDVAHVELRNANNFAPESFSVPAYAAGRRAGQIGFNINCQTAGVGFAVKVVLIDWAGHESNAVLQGFTCVGPSKGTAPVIVDISPQNATVASNDSLQVIVTFSDREGDIVLLAGNSSGQTFFVQDPVSIIGQTSGKFSVDVPCGGQLGKVSYDIFLTDSDNNRSQVKRLDIECVGPSKGTAPVIVDISPNNATIPFNGGSTITITFFDPDADIVGLEGRVLVTGKTFFSDPRIGKKIFGQTRGQYSITQRCNGQVRSFTYNMILIDSQGNESQPKQFSFNCVNNARTSGSSTAPVIVDISPQNATIPVNSKLRFAISFSDSDGDIVRAEGRSLKDGRTLFGFDLPRLNGRTSGRFFGTQPCSRAGNFGYNIVLIDRQGNESQPKQFSFNCVNNARTLGVKQTTGTVVNAIPAPLIDLDSNNTALSVQAVQLNALSAGAFVLRVQGQGVASVQLQVFSLSGDVVFDDTASGNALRWQGLDTDGDALPNGVYFYVATIRGTNGEVQRSKVKKLIILE